MSNEKPLPQHRRWVEQCEAARGVKEQFGIGSALDYVASEKLALFLAAAKRHAEFAEELPAFLREIHSIFTLEEIEGYLAQFKPRKVSKLRKALLTSLR